MTTKIKFRNAISALLISAIATMMIFVANKSNTEDKATLQNLSFYKGQLTNFYPAKLFHSSTGTTSKFVALEISGLDQKIRVFKVGEDYSEFYNNIHIGDTAAIYYRNHSPGFFNSDIYQLDINHKNYLHIDEVKANHAKGNIAVFIIVIFMFGLAIYCLFQK